MSKKDNTPILISELNEKIRWQKEESPSPKNLFSELAEFLFKKCHLKIGNRCFYFTELEFYYYSDTKTICVNNEKIVHRDGFCLRDPKQKGTAQQIASVFCHDYGMDIVIGTEGDAGGVLVRGLKEKDNKNTLKLAGPHQIFQAIYQALGYTDYSRYNQAEADQKKLEEKIKLLKGGPDFETPLIMQGFRHMTGQGTNFTENNRLFKYAPYRYVTDYMEHPFKEKEKILLSSVLFGRVNSAKKLAQVQTPDKKVISDIEEWYEWGIKPYCK